MMKKLISNSQSMRDMNTEHQIITYASQSETVQHLQEAYEYIHQIVQTVKSNSKMHKYFQQCQLTTSNIIQQFTKINNQISIIIQLVQKEAVIISVANHIAIAIISYCKSYHISEINSKQKAISILQIQGKLGCCLDFLHTVKELQPDITNQPKSRHQKVWDLMTIDNLGESSIDKKYQEMKRLLNVTISAVINEQITDILAFKKIIFGLSYPTYMIDSNSGSLKSLKFYLNPTLKQAQMIWDLPEVGASKELIKVVFQSITTNEKIYIPIKKTTQVPNIHLQTPNTIQVRLIHNAQLAMTRKPTSRNCKCCCGGDDVEIENIDTIMIHMHGGGFIAQSSRATQVYTRIWAKALNIPIFSIDYRMPPQHPFPTAVEDCLRVYEFITSQIYLYMNINPKKIIITGESAGGNLAFALTGLIIKTNLPMPYAIYTAYPALDTRLIFSPSRINALTDVLLWPSILLLCLRSYLKDGQDSSYNPMASPILLSEQFVGGKAGDTRFPVSWPRTQLAVGMKDPLYDDTLRIMAKMKQSGVQAQCHIYKHLSHGFLSTGFIISESNTTIADSIIQMKKLLT